MIQAEKHRKLRFSPSDHEVLSLDTREDVLTSYVFGLLRYLPWRIGLGAFLDLAGLHGSNEAGVKVEFWPLKDDTEPDLYIETRSSAVLIEAKLYSGFGSSQLGREWRWLCERSGSKERRLVTLTRTSRSTRWVRSQVNRDLSDLGVSIAGPDLTEVACVTWCDIDILMRGFRNDAHPEHVRAVLEDLCWVFESRALQIRPFEGWHGLSPAPPEGFLPRDWYNR